MEVGDRWWLRFKKNSLKKGKKHPGGPGGSGVPGFSEPPGSKKAIFSWSCTTITYLHLPPPNIFLYSIYSRKVKGVKKIGKSKPHLRWRLTPTSEPPPHRGPKAPSKNLRVVEPRSRPETCRKPKTHSRGCNSNGTMGVAPPEIGSFCKNVRLWSYYAITGPKKANDRIILWNRAHDHQVSAL